MGKCNIKKWYITNWYIIQNFKFKKNFSGTNAVSINVTDKIVPGKPGLFTEIEYNLKESTVATVYTDYDTIAARYSCSVINNQMQEYFYIITRSRGFNDMAKLFNVFEILKKIPVNLSKLQFDLVNDSSCTN